MDRVPNDVLALILSFVCPSSSRRYRLLRLRAPLADALRHARVAKRWRRELLSQRLPLRVLRRVSLPDWVQPLAPLLRALLLQPPSASVLVVLVQWLRTTRGVWEGGKCRNHSRGSLASWIGKRDTLLRLLLA